MLQFPVNNSTASRQRRWNLFVRQQQQRQQRQQQHHQKLQHHHQQLQQQKHQQRLLKIAFWSLIHILSCLRLMLLHFGVWLAKKLTTADSKKYLLTGFQSIDEAAPLTSSYVVMSDFNCPRSRGLAVRVITYRAGPFSFCIRKRVERFHTILIKRIPKSILGIIYLSLSV